MNEQVKSSSNKATNNVSKNQRVLVSVLMLFGFAAILVTGLMSYVMRYSTFLSAVHTFFGLLFVSMEACTFVIIYGQWFNTLKVPLVESGRCSALVLSFQRSWVCF